MPVVGSLLVETLTPLLQESSALGALFEAYPAKMLSFAGSTARGIAQISWRLSSDVTPSIAMASDFWDNLRALSSM